MDAGKKPMTARCEACGVAPPLKNNANCLPCWQAWWGAMVSRSAIEVEAAKRRRRRS